MPSLNPFLRRGSVPMRASSCACPTSPRPRVLELHPRKRGGGTGLSERTSSRLHVVRDQAVPHRPRGVEPVILVGGPGSKCRPFLKVEKNAEAFAACNALADELSLIHI